MKAPEYFVYCGVFMTHFWSERFAHSPKGEFLEVPNKTSRSFDTAGCCYYILSISSALARVVSVMWVPPMILASSFFRPSRSRGVTEV